MKVYLTSLGCKLNQAEIESLGRRLEATGQQVVTDVTQADWAIVNTCTVTHIAARKSRRLLRHLRRENARLRLAVIGCYAEMSPDEVRSLPGVELVIPNALKDQAVSRILEREQGEVSSLGPQARATAPLPGGRTRALVKIQDGCDNRCAYCIVTIARGPSVSRPAEEIVREVQERLDEGYREIVLTGIHIGAYGRDLEAAGQPRSLAELVTMLLQRTNLARLRLSSIEPWDLDDELLACWGDRRLCRRLHLPLQSGCDATLRRMGRKITTAGFAAQVARARRQIPEVAITTDVIVGFPGETEREFAASLAFVEAMAFSRVHVFTYSPRPSTPAAEMPEQVPPRVAQARSKAMLALAKRLAEGYHARLVGREVEVLFESARPKGDTREWNGLTDTYVRLWVCSDEELHNRLRRVRCLAADAAGLRGELLACEAHHQ